MNSKLLIIIRIFTTCSILAYLITHKLGCFWSYYEGYFHWNLCYGGGCFGDNTYQKVFYWLSISFLGLFILYSTSHLISTKTVKSYFLDLYLLVIFVYMIGTEDFIHILSDTNSFGYINIYTKTMDYFMASCIIINISIWFIRDFSKKKIT